MSPSDSQSRPVPDKPGFTTPLQGEWVNDGQHFVLIAPLILWLGPDNEFGIPQGFRTDFASSWIWRWCLLNRVAAFSSAAVWHDWLYYSGAPFLPGKDKRKAADQSFLHAMELSGHGWYDRWKAYWGVRLFGWMAWRAHRQRETIENAGRWE